MSQEEFATSGDALGKRRHSLALEDDSAQVVASGATTAVENYIEGREKKRIRLEGSDVLKAVEHAPHSTIPSGGSAVADSRTQACDTDRADGAEASNASLRLRKRVKLETDTGSQDQPHEVQVSPLLTIPPEIFSEIVMSTSSPADALSLSMTCKALYASLSLPQSSFIWTGLRRNVGKNYDWEVAALGNGYTGWSSDEEKEDKLAKVYGLPDWESIELENGGWKGMLFKSEQEFLGFAYGIGVGAGPRQCEVCGNEMQYGKAYDSYALRISLCDNRACRRSFIADHLISGRHPRVSELGGVELHDALRVHLESQLEGQFRGVNAEFGAGSPGHRDRVIYRKDVLIFERLVRPLLEMKKEQRDEALARETIRMSAWIKLCDSLVSWKKKRKDYHCKVKRANEGRCHALANSHSWNFEDMLNCTVYGSFHRNKNRLMERVSDAEIAALLPTVTSQMATLITKRNRSAQDAVYHTFRDQIASYHKYLVKANLSPESCAPRDIHSIVPALSAFRELEIMRMLQITHIELPDASRGSARPSRSYESSCANNGKNIGRSWRDSVKAVVKQGDIGRSLRADKVLGVVIRDQVGKWIESTREDLRKVLAEASTAVPDTSEPTGVVDGNAGSADTEVKVEEDAEEITMKEKCFDLDPESFTARFRCKQCRVYDGDYAEDECLDFKGVCTHECTVNGAKGNRKAKWSVANFEKDDKAIAVLRQVEEAARKKLGNHNGTLDRFLGLNNTSYPKKVEPTVWRTEVLCLSCEVPMLMKVKNVIGHSHRHEDMEIELVWSHYDADYTDETRRLLGEYREHPLVVAGMTKKMMSKSRETKSKKADKGGTEVTGAKKVKKGKVTAKGRAKGKGKAKVGVDMKGKGKEKDSAPAVEETQEGDAPCRTDGKKDEPEQKIQKEDRKFACRHCHNIQLYSTINAAAEQVSNGEPEEQTDEDLLEAEANSSDVVAALSNPIRRTPAFMGWNGMRSHLKAKHGIASIRDEDYFMKEEPTSPGPAFAPFALYGPSLVSGAVFYLGTF